MRQAKRPFVYSFQNCQEGLQGTGKQTVTQTAGV